MTLAGTAYVFRQRELQSKIELLTDASPLVRASHLAGQLSQALAGRTAMALVRPSRPRSLTFDEGLHLGALLGVLAATCTSVVLVTPGHSGASSVLSTDQHPLTDPLSPRKNSDADLLVLLRLRSERRLGALHTEQKKYKRGGKSLAAKELGEAVLSQARTVLRAVPEIAEPASA